MLNNVSVNIGILPIYKYLKPISLKDTTLWSEFLQQECLSALCRASLSGTTLYWVILRYTHYCLHSKGYVFTGICLSNSGGEVGNQGPGHNTSLPPPRTRAQHLPPSPRTMRWWAVHILLECILVDIKLSDIKLYSVVISNIALSNSDTKLYYVSLIYIELYAVWLVLVSSNIY